MSPITIPGKMTLAQEFTWNETVWNPSMLSTALWLDAADASTITESGGAVSQWDDKSGNGRNAVQASSGSRPEYTANALNNKNVLTLDGTDDFMTVAHAASLNAQISPSTVAIVYKKSAGFRLLQKKDGAGTEADSWFFNDSAILSVGGAFTTSYSSNQDTWQIDVGVWNGSTIKHWRNGSKLEAPDVFNGTLVNGEVDPTATPASNSDDLYIGKRLNPSGTSGIMVGQIAGILICNSVLSTLDRQKLEGYYAHQFGLTANLPADHPYKTAIPVP